VQLLLLLLLLLLPTTTTTTAAAATTTTNNNNNQQQQQHLSCHSVAVVLTLVQTKQLRINIHKRNNTKSTGQTIQTQSIQVHILPKHPHITHTYTLQNKLKQTQYKIYPNEIVTIQSSTLSVMSHGTFIPKNLSVTHFKIKSLHINHITSLHNTILLSTFISWFINYKNVHGANNIQFKKSALTTSLCAEPPAQACRISLTASDDQASNFPGAVEAKKLNKRHSPPPLHPAFVSPIGDRVTFLKPVGWSRYEQVTPSCKPKKDPV
jgi:hypothetical protein